MWNIEGLRLCFALGHYFPQYLIMKYFKHVKKLNCPVNTHISTVRIP